MQIVIDIDDNLYTRLFDNGEEYVADMRRACVAIRKGTPLPKGHGRLIYAKDVGEYLTLADVPTIIEADVPKRRKGTPLKDNDSGYSCENWIP